VIAASSVPKREYAFVLVATTIGYMGGILIAGVTQARDAFLLGALVVGASVYYALVRAHRLLRPEYGAFQSRLRAARRTLEGPKKRMVPWLLLGVAALCLGMYVVQYIRGPTFTDALVLHPIELRDCQRLHTLITSLVAHGGVLHVGYNCLGLVGFGVYVERRAGPAATALLLVSTGVAGGLSYALLTTSPEHGVLGISGAVYGLLGASLALGPRRPIAMTQGGVATVIPAFIALPLITAAYTVADAAFRPNIAWLAHVGGFLAGVFLGLPLRWLPVPAGFAAVEEERARQLSQL
jgi:membrane associated rhomboid family serine protease